MKKELNKEKVKEFVKDRYGKIAKENVGDRGQSCECCGAASAVEQAEAIGYSKKELEKIPDSAIIGLGCGNPVALATLREGETVLDLGSGGGIDVFLAANKVGENGRVIGIDMTQEMIKKARENAKKGGYHNVEFRLGEIEHLPVEDNSIDVILSNCVINLSVDKPKVFQEAYRVLKPGGKLMISDLVTEGELPEEIRKSFDAWAGCIAGALEKKEYMDTIKNAGFQEGRIVSQNTFSEKDMSKELSGKITSVKIEAHKPK
ncbi:arsenite methyltransferase [Candidatus Aerophobetes bacterium]|uniref:Arsenite methyltransferase n=1 Tax=Aerophobetes bacterium TaxID=2030807 RepID=A0A523UKL3_UNCAE|nr:MAG: arsenite methyltransferase [Candidatus Aerophobetes bacterium]